MNTITLRCKACDGVLEIDEDREILCCPYCGSKEIFIESDDVKKERIREKTKKDIALGSKTIERQMKQDEMKHKEKEDKSDMMKLVFLLIAGIIIMILLKILI